MGLHIPQTLVVEHCLNVQFWLIFTQRLVQAKGRQKEMMLQVKGSKGWCIREAAGFTNAFFHQPVLVLPRVCQVGVFSGALQHPHDVTVVMLHAADHSTGPHATPTLLTCCFSWLACVCTYLKSTHCFIRLPYDDRKRLLYTTGNVEYLHCSTNNHRINNM